jgi:hypothetical protein
MQARLILFERLQQEKECAEPDTNPVVPQRSASAAVDRVVL